MLQRVADLEKENSDLSVFKDVHQRIVNTQRELIKSMERDIAEARAGYSPGLYSAALIPLPSDSELSSIEFQQSPYLNPILSLAEETVPSPGPKDNRYR